MKSTWETTSSTPTSAASEPEDGAVKRYVLPKFKVEVKADKTFYLPETVKVIAE